MYVYVATQVCNEADIVATRGLRQMNDDKWDSVYLRYQYKGIPENNSAEPVEYSPNLGMFRHTWYGCAPTQAPNTRFSQKHMVFYARLFSL